MKRAIILGTVLLMTLAHPAEADTRSNIQANFNHCGIFSDDRTWLNCIYGAVQPMRSQLGLPPAPAFQTSLVPGDVPIPQASSSPSTLPPPPPDTRQQNSGGESFASFLMGGRPVLTNVSLTAYSINKDGLFTVTLANGEVWYEMEGEPLAHWHKPASYYRATIFKGSLGSFNFIIVGEGIQYKVRRVR